MSCAARLQGYDLERDQAQRTQIAATVWGAETKVDSSKSLPPNGRKQTMTQADIMEKYGNQHG